MPKQIEAIYEKGIIRPLQPLDLPEGCRLVVIVLTQEEPRTTSEARELIAEIAALPLEGSIHTFSGRDHDSILFFEK